MRSRCATPDTRAIIQREVERRVKEESQKQTRIIAERLTTAIDAASMWVLHEEFGFGKERLERFFTRLIGCIRNWSISMNWAKIRRMFVFSG